MTQIALDIRDVSMSFGKTDVLRALNLSVAQGERLALIGPNGAGKSTLFNVLSGRMQPTSGHILLNGRSVLGLPPYRIRRQGLSRSFQITNLFGQLSVKDNLRCALLWSMGYRYSFWHRLSRLLDVDREAARLLEAIGLSARTDSLAAALTYAEQRALEIAVTIAGGAQVILLDEPTAGMSRDESDRMIDLIRRMTEGKTLLMVEHDMQVVFGLADRIAVLVQGDLLACDEPERVRANPEVQRAYLGDFAIERGRDA